MNPKPIVLIILDGFGIRESKQYNAISMAATPTFDKIWQQYPHTTLIASGEAVGLPIGQMGNSEVGHLTMGAGRVIPQDLTRINHSISDQSFYQNTILIEMMHQLKKSHHALHILGLLSKGGVHSHQNHIESLISFTNKNHVQTYLHAFLDGRDTPPTSAMGSLLSLQKLEGPYFKIASLCGRYYAMDRDNRYERTETCYRLITEGVSEYHADNAIDGLKAAYERKETDEFVKPTIIGKKHFIQDQDAVIFMNFRSDRARQLSYALTEPHFQGFKREVIRKIFPFITLTKYAEDIKASVLFEPISLNNLLGLYLSEKNLKQLRLAETEKYAHVTYFFDGGQDILYNGEERILIPSPKVATYDLEPSMSAEKITESLINAITRQEHDVIICNFANADMVGHTGNLKATILAIETIDQCLKHILEALQSVQGEALITADHGNAEIMYDENLNQSHTAHTDQPVPFVYIGRKASISKQNGTLADIAATVLYLLGLPKPKEMTGSSLIKF